MKWIIFSGLPGTGKSTLAEAVGKCLGIPVFAKDWLEALLLQVRIDDAEIVRTGYQLLYREGLFLGGTSGTNVAAAVQLAKQLGPGNTIVTILCDGGQKYLSRFWNREYLVQKGLAGPADEARRAGVAAPPAGRDH